MTWRGLAGLLFASVLLTGLWLASMSAPPSGQVQRIRQAAFVPSPGNDPPGPDAGWQPVALPVTVPPGADAPPRATWYRLRFDLADAPASFWGVYLPFFYGGGQVWLNGQRLADIPGATPRVHVRWERPQLVAVPQPVLHAGANELWVHALPVVGETVLKFPEPRVGPLDDLREVHDNRLFWVRTVPQLTVAACLALSAFGLLIWSRLPEETLYGWFALAALLWGVRTLTFVLETMPVGRLEPWRLAYLASTGGFIVAIALFALHLTGVRRRWLDHGLLLYWLAGPAWLLWQGIDGDAQVNRLWTAGLIPIGLLAVVLSFLAAWRQRTLISLILPVALALATVSGVHDYLIAWQPDVLDTVMPAWAGQRYFLLHHGANLLLLAMGTLLSARYVRSVRALRELNQTLESRVADREKTLAEQYVGMARLERQNAAGEERRLIMREIHDGLGSKLFTSLSRVERGAMDGADMAAALRACISDMRLALDALAPDDHDLLTAFGDFMFRWQSELEAAGVRCVWSIEVAEEHLHLPPHTTLQLLRVAQEALTNVAKHARATRVELSLQHADGHLRLRIEDNGIGAAAGRRGGGRGLHNMQARATQLGGVLAIDQAEGRGTAVSLAVPVAAAAAQQAAQ